MLVLSRRPGERIIVTLPTGDTIIIGIGGVDATTNGVKIGLDAPRSITIDREEVWERKQAEIRSKETNAWPTQPRIIKKGTSPLSLKKP